MIVNLVFQSLLLVKMHTEGVRETNRRIGERFQRMGPTGSWRRSQDFYTRFHARSASVICEIAVL